MHRKPYFLIKRFIPYFRATTDGAVSMVKCEPMNKDDIHQDACTLLALLRRDEDSLNDAGKQLVKQNKDYSRDVFMHEVDGWTPFHAFVLRGARKMVKLCLKAKVDVNATMGSPDGLPGGCSALHLAAHRGDVSIINILVSNGADLDLKDNLNRTPVIYASRANNTLAVKTLQRAGADMSGCDANKQSSDDMTSSPIVCFLPFVCAGVRR
ncbi:ankyrin repeat and protein kinase domain-containing protein 1-like isoform X3 [Mercenaria mercenaria]|uniref:ankyrin repeat and protein kinase domain-containing protein 1-like isoform X3 n=1 Tax=Mercenaria mercenaria TaxID=6596 RepID=UPI00234EFE44|nr:ankyrin repeat and protein kinase domain-containing protein 1-like isoform X3 [Mercenaria mercenaria]